MQVQAYPGSSAIIALLLGAWVHLRAQGGTYQDVGLSYESCVQQRQLWRVSHSCRAQPVCASLPLQQCHHCTSAWSLGAPACPGLHLSGCEPVNDSCMLLELHVAGESSMQASPAASQACWTFLEVWLKETVATQQQRHQPCAGGDQPAEPH